MTFRTSQFRQITWAAALIYMLADPHEEVKVMVRNNCLELLMFAEVKVNVDLYSTLL